MSEKKINVFGGVYFRGGEKPKYNNDGDILNEEMSFQSDVLGSHLWFKKTAGNLVVCTDFGGYGEEKVEDGTFKLKNQKLLDKGFFEEDFGKAAGLVLTEESVLDKKKYNLCIKHYVFGAMSDEWKSTPELDCVSEFLVEVDPTSVVVVDKDIVMYENKDGVMCYYSVSKGREKQLKESKDFDEIKDKLGELILAGAFRGRR